MKYVTARRITCSEDKEEMTNDHRWESCTVI